MARQLRIEYPGAFYHITSRGNERKNIYSADSDKKRFLEYLKAAHDRFKIMIHAYCLMPNHYHFLMETPMANLSRSMQFLNSSYTTYYNKKRKRIGHLFQGRYKAILVDKDSYLETLSRYIHLNPVRAHLVKQPEDYLWSSYRYYLSSDKIPEFLNTKFTLSLFSSNKGEYKDFVEEGLNQKIKNPFKDIKANLILGDKKFIKDIKNKYLKDKQSSRDLADLRELKKDAIHQDRIIDILKKEKSLKEKARTKWTIYFLRKYTGYTLGEISGKVNNGKIGISAISQTVGRTEQKIKENLKTAKEFKELERKILNV
jgi:putative transposase